MTEEDTTLSVWHAADGDLNIMCCNRNCGYRTIVPVEQLAETDPLAEYLGHLLLRALAHQCIHDYDKRM